MAKKKTDKIEKAPELEGVVVEAAAAEEAEALMEFDEWYSLREKAIPRQHHKEILKADFKARKIPQMATQAQFDEALRKYGVKLA